MRVAAPPFKEFAQMWNGFIEQGDEGTPISQTEITFKEYLERNGMALDLETLDWYLKGHHENNVTIAGDDLQELGIWMHVRGIWTKPSQRGKGYGNIIMRKLCDGSDETQIGLILTPRMFDRVNGKWVNDHLSDGAMTNEQLETWYRGMGFLPHDIRKDILIRVPQ